MTSTTKHACVRPAFRRALEQWADVAVIAEEPGVVTLRPAAETPRLESTVLVIVGKNRLDPHLFERCAVHHIGRFLEDGWSIKLLDFEFDAESSTADARSRPAPGTLVAKVLAETDRLRYVLLLTHSRWAINLSDSGNDLVVGQHVSARDRANGSTPSSSEVPIPRLRLAESAAKDGWIDVFGCFCRPEARWPRELAKALGWPVRTVYPGYGIYFPAGDDYPKSAIPFTRAFSRSRYSKRGWAVWFPSADRPVRVSEPSETAQRYDSRYDVLERFLVTVVSVGLEPVRDFLKKRRLAVHARRPSASL